MTHANALQQLCRGKYQIVKYLSRGSFGTTYKGKFTFKHLLKIYSFLFVAVVNRKTKKDYATKVEYKDAEHIKIRKNVMSILHYQKIQRAI